MDDRYVFLGEEARRLVALRDEESSFETALILDGHLAAREPDAAIEDALVAILDGAFVDPLIGTVTLPLQSGDLEFHSAEALRLFLRGLKWVPTADQAALFHSDTSGERVPAGVVEAALQLSGLEYALPNRPEHRPVAIYESTIEPSPIVLPVNDLVLVNAELLAMLRKHPQLLHTLDPRQFEELVCELFRDLGYDTVLTPRSRDGGRDVRAVRKDKAGSFLYLVECKRWAPTRPVGVEIVRGLYGVVAAERASCGIVATTSRFTAGAKEFASQVKYQMSLRDFEDLRAWLKEYPFEQSTAPRNNFSEREP